MREEISLKVKVNCVVIPHETGIKPLQEDEEAYSKRETLTN